MFVSCNLFLIFKVCFFWYHIAAPALFLFLFAWNIFFHSFTFSLFVSLDLKWISCRQHIVGSCILIHSANLCLLIREFNPATFEIITDKEGATCHCAFCFLNVCHGLNVCVPTKFMCWNPMPQCVRIWRWGLWEAIKIRWGHESGTLMNGIHAFIGVMRELASSPSFCHVRIKTEVGSL